MKIRCLLLVALWLCALDLGSPSERCDDWGVDTMKHKPVYNGEPAKIKCPLFEAFLKYNYSTAHSAGLTLIWYWIGRGQDIEEPINFRLPDNHISKEKDTLWFRPALLNDTGNYTCMLRNTTYCSKVAFPLEVVDKDPGSCVSQAIRPEEVLMYLDYTNKNLTCPDVEGFYPAGTKPKVWWYMNCKLMDNFNERYPRGINLTFGFVREAYQADYTCVVSYKENGRDFNLTRTLRVKVVGPPDKATVPTIISPNKQVGYELTPGEALEIRCEVQFTFLKDSPQEVWWMVDGKSPEDVSDLKFNITLTEIPSSLGEMTIVKTLVVPKVTERDLKRNYTCCAHNLKGTVHQEAMVKMKVPVPRYTVELVCGLGATIVLVVLLTLVYHFYWLEMVLFYRAHFGTDETILDGKEYDIYVSYARNAEEEEFVLLTLRGVLENEFGYKLCIFDRDSLPGGNTTEAIFDFIQRSRKMIVVLSPDYLLEKSISMLEFKLGLLCQNNIATKLLVVEYRPLLRAHPNIQQLRESVAFVAWKGERSKRPGSKFWKALRLALPLRSLSAAGSCSWNESCSSHSDISLDHVQKKKGRLKGSAEAPGSRPKGLPVQRGLAPLPRSKAKDHAKPFLACRCCVAYCNENHKLGGHGRGGAKPKPGLQCHRTPAGEATGRRLQKSEKPSQQHPPSALSLRHYADLSNNNDFYVL
uniref:Interleukin 1 receptor accessory protein n=2 Tax=Podarcis muralis TaxID=64176 RepID=A0A670KHJ2_PODMU|nr:interleukin-1 receptor accessory protein isoform X1 [Podarcis muralis]XP_028587657.1 interleukin-1 receptor accessory protein isoform X1 [Podarcis muralis]XP_028587658.1 interleukin-1 receptor accessory protein isoform X1 [Podarcis muralis]XP_028587659.1 interleukin-1 receptor accessory protein isoform X1 [Podarcis muralis]